MFPQLTETTSCLESLLELRSACDTDDVAPMYIEAAGFDTQRLSKLARGSNFSAKDFFQQQRQFAALEMLGQIQLFINNGYSLRGTINDVCSTCNLMSAYVPGGGIVVKNVSKARFGTFQITNLNVLCNRTGNNVVVFDDGVNLTTYTVACTAGQVARTKLSYSTTESKVKIYFQDNTIGSGTVVCAANTGCGCGRSATSNPIVMTGLLGANETSTQYGFTVCASVSCSMEAMICRMVANYPNVLAWHCFIKQLQS